ncbi:MAG: GNAT family N-acetyltransferase [Rhizobiales bacterium]|nr:GNAT family N-acetyltransferase [Hyphomicrobiales bacterium]MDQ3557632.1 GNAT family N-acetyltransferase [Pseudomonadota bacterium]
MTGVSAEIIESSDALAALEPGWWSLWRRSSTALPFQSPAWLIPWWRHFAPGALFTLAAWKTGRLVGLAPFYVEDGPLGRRLLPIGISLSDHLDVLADRDCAEEAMDALVAAAMSRDDAWDLWELEELLPDALAMSLTFPAGYVDDIAQQSPCPVLMIPDGVASYPAILSQKKRRNINLARNRCARRGTVSIERAQGDEALDALEHLFRLHAARWALRGEAGVLAPHQVRSFQRDAVPGLEAAGLLRIHTLAIGDRVVAVYYALSQNSRFSVYLTGFDPDFDFESPGVVLLAHVIGEAVAEGCREIDFLRGQEPYKYEWGAVDRWNLKRSIWRAGNA